MSIQSSTLNKQLFVCRFFFFYILYVRIGNALAGHLGSLPTAFPIHTLCFTWYSSILVPNNILYIWQIYLETYHTFDFFLSNYENKTVSSSQNTKLIYIIKSCLFISPWARSCENVSYAICEQQMCKSACTSARSDQHFVVRCLDSMILILALSKVSRF